MNAKQRQLMDDLHQLNPVREEDGEDWARSQRGQDVLSRVLRKRNAADTQLPPIAAPRNRRHLRTGAAIVGGLVAIALAVILPLTIGSPSATVLTSSPSTSGPVASQRTPSTAQSPGTATVSGEKAIEDILALASAMASGSQSGSGTKVGGGIATLRRAIQLGLIPASQLAGNSLSVPVTRAQFAVWLWKMFGPMLERRQAVTFSDLGSLSRDERQAVEGLAAAGIVSGYDDGTFRGHDLLSEKDEALYLQQIENARKS